MKSLILSALAPAMLLAFAPPLTAQESDAGTQLATEQLVVAEEQALSHQAANVFFLMSGTKDVEVADIFSAQFLSAVPAAQLNGILDQLQDQYGPVVSVFSVERTGAHRARVSFRFERAIVSGDMVLNPAMPHQIEGLLLNDFELIGDKIGAIREELEALPGEVGVYFGSLDGTRPQLEINADKQFAIGSTFKLYVLSALTAEMEADNDRYWDEVTYVGAICLDVRCPKEGRSFPSGITQDWPAPMPMTVQTLATLMISQSDNTATDALIEYLGEERIVQEMIDSGHSAPALNQPFLTTRQMFALKASDDAVIAAYRQGDLDTKYDLAWEARDRSGRRQRGLCGRSAGIGHRMVRQRARSAPAARAFAAGPA